MKLKIIKLIVLMVSLLLSLSFLQQKTNFLMMDMSVRDEDDSMLYYKQDYKTFELLERYQPEIYIAESSYFPINFYDDYLEHTILKKQGMVSKKVLDEVTPEVLSEYQFNNDYFLDFEITSDTMLNDDMENYSPVSYGRIYETTLTNGIDNIELLFLKYTYVFPYSGLPEGISEIKKFGSDILANSLAWHELDIHGSVYVILRKSDYKEIGIMLAQHNNFKTYLYGKDIMPFDDNKVKITFSKYSNEPYIYNEVSRYENVIGIPTSMDFLYGRTDKVPLGGGLDYVSGADDSLKVECDLKLLPLDDPLYKATISLGNRPKLLGLYNASFVDGPPGIDFYMMEPYINLADIMCVFYGEKEDDKYFEYFDRDFKDLSNLSKENLLPYQQEKIIGIIKDMNY